MPLPAPTLVGSTVDATILDGNFEALRQYLQEQVVDGDISPDQLTRWIIRNYSAGKIAGVTTLEEPIFDYWEAKLAQPKTYHEVTYRKQLLTENYIPQIHHTMELLGTPGPSFYWQYQEDGITYVGAPDPNRYDPALCYSYWLTVPGASVKVYVPERCIAKLHGRAYYLGNFTASAEYVKAIGGLGTWRNAANPNKETLGREIAMRFGLFVDTNPNLFGDEFPNTNSNILNPVTGAQATHKSWEEVASKTVTSPLWQREGIDGEIVLKGGRWYNFSLKYRGAGAMGYRAAGANPFIDNIFEYASAGLPNYNGANQSMIGTPPFEMQWISTALNIEFFYGHDTIESDSASIGTIIP